ncbi:hypothetical protein [Mesorhizobium sp. M0643]|uniref:hypothetical protein n=1 Tax=Mesorhizobium sp. M0643 TaxID=2956978 RepID=UPI00333DCDC6
MPDNDFLEIFDAVGDAEGAGSDFGTQRRRIPRSQFRHQQGGVPVYRRASKFSVVPQHDYCCACYLNRPFCDRVADAAEKTAESVLFDVRVDGDSCVQRMAAIGYGV